MVKKINFFGDRKGQLKIQQMMFLILAVTLLFSLVGMFFFSISLGHLKKTAQNTESNNALLLVSKLAKSPEFSCGNSLGNVKSNCVDFDKVIVLSERIEKYTDFWGVSKIEIKKVYPYKNNLSCNKANYQTEECGVITILNKNVPSLPASSNFISLCRKERTNSTIYNKCELARLIVSSEDRT
jgi:hypothetical protein